MLIGGFQKLTLPYFPGKVACILFIPVSFYIKVRD